VDRALAISLMEAILGAEPNLERLSVLCAKDQWRGLRRQVGMVMSSYTHMTMSIVHRFPDLDPDRDGAKVRPFKPAEVSNALEIGEALRGANADLDRVAALADRIGAEDEKRAFCERVVEASELYRALTDAVAQGRSP
jgi:hypothetical protein